MTYSSNSYSFQMLSLNNHVSSSIVVSSIITTKYAIFDNLSYTTSIASFPATNSNLVIKFTIKCIYSFSSILFIISIMNLEPQSRSKKRTLYRIYTRELNKTQYRTVYLIYTRLLVHTIVLLTYSKGHTLSIRLTYIKHIIVILFLPKSSTMFCYVTA